MEFKLQDERKVGLCTLIYGDTGVGKTSALITLPEPILIYVTEPRNPIQTITSSYPELAKNANVTFRSFAAFDDYVDNLAALKADCEAGTNPFASVAFDSLSFMQSEFKLNLEDDRFTKEIGRKGGEKKRDNLLVDRFRVEMADWGGLGSMMKRLTRLLNSLATFGVTVVATATTSEHPSWNSGLNKAPNFMGKEFPEVYHGYFDFVFYVEARSDNKYPPLIAYYDDVAWKSCSNGLTMRMTLNKDKAPLDFRKLLPFMRNEK